MAHFDRMEFEWELIRPLLPGKPRRVARVDGRRVLKRIFRMLRTGSPGRDLPERYGPYTTGYNRFNGWAKSGARVQVSETLAEKSSDSMQSIDNSVIRAHQRAAAQKGGRITPLTVLVTG
jgi:transposase